MSFDRDLGTTVRKEHILQIVKAWEGDESYGTPLVVTAVNSSTQPAVKIRNRYAGSVGLLVRNSTDTGDLLRVTDAGVSFSFTAGSINGGGVVSPSISLGGDSDTGFWHPGGTDNNGYISLASQGAEVERWTPALHTMYLPISLASQVANSEALVVAPVQVASGSQVGPKIILRATSKSGSTNNLRDFMFRTSTSTDSGDGKLEILTRLNSGSETVCASFGSDGSMATPGSVSRLAWSFLL